MAIFHWLYHKVQAWAGHPHAARYLAGVSFIESSFFPIPPDVMLIPMVLNKPSQAWRYAMITTVASIIGGIAGYAIGYYVFEYAALPMVHFFGYQTAYATAVHWFEKYGFFAVVVAGFTPIPYKIFTIAAGVTQMALLPFIGASIIGRGLRFFLVALIVRHFGKKIEPFVIKYIDILGWGLVVLLAAAIIVYKFLSTG